MLTVLRVVASFAIVGVLLWAFMRASNGKLGALMAGGARGRLSDPLAVLDRRQLTKTTALALVRAGERHLLVGVSDHGVQLLAEGDDLAVGTEPIDDVADMSAPAVVVPSDVVSETAQPIDQPNAWTRFGRATAPRPPRMSFVAALREMTVRRS